MSFNNKGFIFLEIIISLILLFTLLTVFVAINSNSIRLLEKIELDNIFYINSLNLGNELVVYLLDNTELPLELNNNYTINEIEANYYKFNSEIDNRIKEEIQVKIIREDQIYNSIIYNLNIIYGDNEIKYLFMN